MLESGKWKSEIGSEGGGVTLITMVLARSRVKVCYVGWGKRKELACIHRKNSIQQKGVNSTHNWLIKPYRDLQ